MSKPSVILNLSKDQFRLPFFGGMELLFLFAFTAALHAQDQPAPMVDNTTSPYHVALLDYKSGKYEEARTAIDAAEKANPGDLPTEVLKARILTEQKQYNDAAKLLESLNGNPGRTPAINDAIELAFGDLCLRKHSFDEAAKFYESLLARKPNDPDIILKVVYSRVGASDFLTAAKIASQLKPFDTTADPLDPKHPGNPAYYFAKAALAQATGKGQEADDDIETSRTLYGIITTNHYLKTYLQVFDSSQKDASPASRAEPPATNTPTSAPAQ